MPELLGRYLYVYGQRINYVRIIFTTANQAILAKVRSALFMHIYHNFCSPFFMLLLSDFFSSAHSSIHYAYIFSPRWWGSTHRRHDMTYFPESERGLNGGEAHTQIA